MSNIIMFAQGNNDDNGDLEGDDPPAAPINSRIIVLFVIAIAYGFYIIKQQRKLAK